MTNPEASTDVPNFWDYDLLLVNTSGGKDSQVMLDFLVAEADRQGYPRARLVAVHADLGRVEWEGTRELAEDQVNRYGLRFEVISRPQGDLLDQIEDRGKFPSNSARYCTSDHKTGQVSKVMTALVREIHQAEGSTARQVRILNCLGLRAEESPVRAKKPSFEFEARASNGRRHVDRWLPIHAMTEWEVWARIEKTGVPHHPAYDAGMPRLSCSFCVLASKSALVLAAQLRPDLAAEYARVEAAIGHDFRQDLPMREIIREAQEGQAVTIEGWDA